MARNSFSNLRKNSSSKPTSLVASRPESTTSKGPGSADSASGLKSESLDAKVTIPAVAFGRPSDNKASSSTSSSGNEWKSLLQQTASGGIASAFSGSFGLGSIGGIGSIVSGIMSFFAGGKSKKPALAPLPEFSLPQQVAQTEYISRQGISTSQGALSQVSSGAAPSSGIYNPSPLTISASPIVAGSNAGHFAAGGVSGDWIQGQSTQIAQAVKSALLNSSSLNDVIAEI